MPGARCTRSLACEIKKHASKVTTGSPNGSGIPCAMVLTVSFVVSPETGLSCLRHRHELQKHPCRFDASVGAPERYDFAVRDRSASSSRIAASTASLNPTFVTIAKRPSCGYGTRLALLLFLPIRETKYFFLEGWTAIRANSSPGKVHVMSSLERRLIPFLVQGGSV